MDEYIKMIDAEKLNSDIRKIKMSTIFPSWERMSHEQRENLCKLGRKIRNIIDEQPAADVVEVVRCKDCEYGIPYQDNPFEDETGWFECSYYGCGIADEGSHFCSHGKRKDGKM